MLISRLSPNEPLPALVTPDGDRDLLRVARAERDNVRRLMREHGALLFRGYDVTTPAQFGDICAALTNELLDYRAIHAAKQVEGGCTRRPNIHPRRTSRCIARWRTPPSAAHSVDIRT
jgi:hypothetical protein